MSGKTIYDLSGSERDVLLYYLTKMRNAAVRTSEGLTDEQQRTHVVPSGTNLLGLIQHLAGLRSTGSSGSFSARGIAILMIPWTYPSTSPATR